MSVLVIHGVAEEYVRRCQLRAGLEEDCEELHVELGLTEVFLGLVDTSVDNGFARYVTKRDAVKADEQVN